MKPAAPPKTSVIRCQQMAVLEEVSYPRLGEKGPTLFLTLAQDLSPQCSLTTGFTSPHRCHFSMLECSRPGPLCFLLQGKSLSKELSGIEDRGKMQ